MAQDNVVPSFMQLKKQNRKNESADSKRKRAKNRRSDMLHARVTPGEFLMVQQMAAEVGLCLSEYIVWACFHSGGETPEGRRWLASKK